MLNRVADVIEKAMGTKATVENIMKNGEERECILVGDDENVRTVLYKEHVEQVINEHGFYNGCKELVKIVEKRRLEDVDGILNVISNWEYAKPHLINCLRQPTKKSNQITKEFLDMEQYCRLDFSNSTVVVTENLLEKWEVSADEMFEAACENQTYCVRGLAEMTAGIELPKEEEVTFVAGGDRCYGAGIICDPDMMKIIIGHVGMDYYIIPSSVHEVLIMRENFTDNLQDLKDLLKNVNNNEVCEEERLSYNIYKYTKENGLSIVA